MTGTTTNASTTTEPLTLEMLQKAFEDLPPVPTDYLIEAHGKIWKFKDVGDLFDYPPGAIVVSSLMASRFRAMIPEGQPLWGAPIFEEDDEARRTELVITCCKRIAKRLPLPDFIREPLSFDPWAAAPAAAAVEEIRLWLRRR